MNTWRSQNVALNPRNTGQIKPTPAVTAEQVNKAENSSVAENALEQTDEFPDPFTDMSEEEADRIANPFTGQMLAKVEKAKTLPNQATAADGSKDSSNSEPSDAGSAQMADLQATTTKKPETPDDSLDSKTKQYQTKLLKIAERKEQSGFRGFCPVALRDDRTLLDAKAEISSVFKAKTYHFSSTEAKSKFNADPQQYAPVSGGQDVILLANNKETVEGSVENAVWYRNRLYLFQSSETKATFVREPAKFAELASKPSTKETK